jgi:hypothetical protein
MSVVIDRDSASHSGSELSAQRHCNAVGNCKIGQISKINWFFQSSRGKPIDFFSIASGYANIYSRTRAKSGHCTIGAVQILENVNWIANTKLSELHD